MDHISHCKMLNIIWTYKHLSLFSSTSESSLSVSLVSKMNMCATNNEINKKQQNIKLL